MKDSEDALDWIADDLECYNLLSMDLDWESGNARDLIEALQQCKQMLVAATPVDILNNSMTIFCTLTTSGRQHLKEMDRVEYLIVDEAGAAVEADTLIPIVHHEPSKLVLVGDIKQLPAVVTSETCIDRLFDRSMMERLGTDCEMPVSMFTIQYRMHPAIREWPSTAFYDDRLVDAGGLAGRQPPAGLHLQLRPLVMFDMDNAEAKDGTGYSNRVEAENVVKLVQWLRNKCPKASIGVITFYRAQVNMIKSLLDRAGKTQNGSSNDEDEESFLKVATVDSFQGSERDIIILSLVRSNRGGRIGFLRDARRLNVAITRAKHALIMLGNARCLRAARDGYGDPHRIAELMLSLQGRGLIKPASDLSSILSRRNAGSSAPPPSSSSATAAVVTPPTTSADVIQELTSELQLHTISGSSRFDPEQLRRRAQHSMQPLAIWEVL